MDAEESDRLTTREQQLLNGERLVYAKRVRRATLGDVNLSPALVVLTNRRLIASKPRTFGAPKPDISVNWDAVNRANGEPSPADPMQIVLTFTTDFGLLVLQNDPLTIYEFETRGRSLYRQ